MSALIRAALLLCVLFAPARADREARVVVADPDPELARAIQAVLAPWKLEVVVAAEPGDDARFVVWRADGELLVLDRVRGETQRRAAPAGPLDPASAAAAALTVKTLLRLPPPDAAVPPAAELVAETPAPPPRAEGTRLRVELGLGSRLARGDDTIYGARVALATFVQPARSPLAIGIAGELGTAHDIKDSGFRGTWRDWSVLALASWTVPFARWELAPFAGAGITRSRVDGEDMMTERHERATLALLRAGAVARVRADWLSVGAALSIDAVPGTPTYTRAGIGSQFFAVPPFALSLGVVVAADLGR